MSARRAAIGGILAATAGCAFPQSPLATPGGTVYQGTTDAMLYRSTQPRDVRPPPWRRATGESCRTMLSWPLDPPTPFLGSSLAASYLPWPSFSVTWGDDGYARAVARARKAAGGGMLFDVRADVHTTAVLGIWRRECVEIHALVAAEGH